MKLAEIIPVYKSKEKNLMTNYRTISLLITSLKLLEKVMYKIIYHFLDSNNVFFKTNIVLGKTGQAHMQFLN